MKKKQNKRSKTKYPTLDPKLNLRTRQEALDVDYADNLPQMWVDPKTGEKWSNDRLKAYLNTFLNESVNTSFDKNPKNRVHKKKKVPNPINEDLNEMRLKLLKISKDINEIINSSVITVKTKNSLRKILSKFKKNFKKILTNSMTNIDDYYKKDSETRNNTRNSDVLTRAKAQGKNVDLNNVPEDYLIENTTEDDIIDLIDSKREEND